MIEAMASFDETCGAAQPRTGGGDGLCRAPAAWSCEAPDWRALHEAERVRADAAEAGMCALRGAEMAARARAGTWTFPFDRTRHPLKAARAEVKAVRREAMQGQALAEALERERDALKRPNAEPERERAQLRGTRAPHVKARFGSKSEKQKKEGTGNPRVSNRSARARVAASPSRKELLVCWV